jgi:hypothetical protein
MLRYCPKCDRLRAASETPCGEADCGLAKKSVIDRLNEASLDTARPTTSGATQPANHEATVIAADTAPGGRRWSLAVAGVVAVACVAVATWWLGFREPSIGSQSDPATVSEADQAASGSQAQVADGTGADTSSERLTDSDAVTGTDTEIEADAQEVASAEGNAVPLPTIPEDVQGWYSGLCEADSGFMVRGSQIVFAPDTFESMTFEVLQVLMVDGVVGVQTDGGEFYFGSGRMQTPDEDLLDKC